MWHNQKRPLTELRGRGGTNDLFVDFYIVSRLMAMVVGYDMTVVER